MTIGDDSTVEVVEDGAGSIDDSTRQQQSQPLHHGEEDRMMMIHQTTFSSTWRIWMITDKQASGSGKPLL